MGAHLAALLNSEYASGLATAALLTQDVTDTPLIPVDGEIEIGRVNPDEDLLYKTQALEDRPIWWQLRLNRVLNQI
jgi:O-succinylbenzoate synthase